MKLPGVVKHWQRKNLLHFGPVSLDTGCDEVRALQNAPVPAGMTVALRALISYHVTANFSGLLDSNFISIENFCSGHNSVPPKVWIALKTVVIHYTQATE